MKRGGLLPLMLFLFAVTIFLFSALIPFNATALDGTNISNVTIQLSKDKYILGEQLEGKLLLKITNLTTPDDIITVRKPGLIKSFKLIDLFQNISVNFTITKGKFEGTNPSSTKSIDISSGQEKLFGVILPAFSEVITLNMSVSGAANNQLKKLNMDIGLDDIIDWFYLGNFIGWNSLVSSPEDLIETEGKIIIRDSGASASIYCQRIDLPFSKDYNVTVSYKSLNAGGDLKAVIYSIIGGDPAFPTGGSNLCDLPEAQTSGYHSCTIHFPSAEHGDHLVCVYNDGASVNDAYELNTDISHETETAFACQRTEPIFCESSPNTNYFIKAYGAQYSEALTSTVNFDEWSLGINASLEALKKEVGSYPYPGNCAPGLCLVPISIQGTDSGTISLSNLKIRYETGGIAKTTVEADKFYDVIEGKDKFATIKDLALTEPIIIEVPLSIFKINATAPEKEGAESATAKLEAGFGNNLETNATFTVFFNNIPAEGSQLMINEIRDSISALPSDEDALTLLELSGLKQITQDASNSLAGFETRLISGDTPELQTDVTTLRATLPKSITKKSSIADIQLIEPDDVTSDIADSDKKNDVYLLQDSVSVTIRLTEYEVTDFADNIKTYTLVKKTIKAKKGLSKLDVFEAVSKTAASSAEEIKFRETPKIVNSDPLVKWYLASLSSGLTKDFVYLVETSSLNTDDFKTIIATSAEDKCGNGKCDAEEDEDSCAADCKPSFKCGDGVCTLDLEDATTCPKDCKGTFPWFYVIVGVIILGGVLALFLLKGKKPFKTENDLKTVTDYIKIARQKKVNDKEIIDSLMQRGWTKTQVDYAFAHLASNADVKPMQEYIQKAAAKNIPLTAIKQKLLAQGWDAKVVDRELKNYKK